VRRPLIAAATAAFFLALLWFVSVRQAALLLVGVGMGATLAGARFGFTTGWRRLVVARDASGILGQLLLLAVAAALAMPLLARFPELRPALGPPSVSLVVGAFVFGLTMQIADGCGSGTLYKAGMGVPLSMAVLPLFALGSFLGAEHVDAWLRLGSVAPVGLVEELGPGAALLATFVGLAGTAWLVGRRAGAGARRLERRWVFGAVALALLATLNLVIAGQPWGVVYGFGLWGAKLAQAAGVLDPAASSFWSQPGNARILAQSVLLDITTITNLGVFAGALWFADDAAAAQPLTAAQWAAGLVAGLLMGYSSRLAFGCNVGAMISGISTGSLHGWIWVALAFCGTLFGIRIRHRLGM
jgi:uncharacterized membrane protein YedE/YeeE